MRTVMGGSHLDPSSVGQPWSQPQRAGVFDGVLQETCLATFTRNPGRGVWVYHVNGHMVEMTKVAPVAKVGPWLLPRHVEDVPVTAHTARLPLTLGIDLDVSGILPDAIIADLGTSPVEFWLIEVVATDGPVTEHRKAELLAWAKKQHVPVANCQFLSAFQARTQSGFRKRVAELATGSYAWFLDEPGNELAWDELGKN
jgi:hypothetical protein